MTPYEVTKALETLDDALVVAYGVVIKGRTSAVLSCTIASNTIPRGWRPIGQPKGLLEAGHIRIVYTGESVK